MGFKKKGCEGRGLSRRVVWEEGVKVAFGEESERDGGARIV